MFELFAGEPPFFVNDIQQLFEIIKHQPAPTMASKCPDLPLELCVIVDRLLRKDPAERFQSGQELAAVLTRIYDRLRYSGEQIARRESQDTLRSLGFFNDFTDSEIDEILNVSTMVSFKKGDVIIQEGDIDNTFYIIALGQVDVKKAGKTLQTFGKGDCFGEIGFLMNTKRTATIIANTPVVVLKVNATQMQRVSKECQLRYYRVFTENLIYRLSYTTAKLAAVVEK
jgi:serine/threonine-protein kinase